MGKIRTAVTIVGTIIGSAIIYETTIIGSRALTSDMKYIKEGHHDGPPVKKHWWSKKRGER